MWLMIILKVTQKTVFHSLFGRYIFGRTIRTASNWPPPSLLGLRIGSSSEQLHFETATFLVEELFRIEISTEELLFWTRYFGTILTLSEKLHFWKSCFFRQEIFRITYFLLRAIFFEDAASSKEGIFYSSYRFRRTAVLQHTFSEELLFHLYASFPQLHFLFISY